MKKEIRKQSYKKIKKSNYGLIGLIKENKGLVTFLIKTKKKALRIFPTEKNEHFFSHTYSYKYRSIFSKLIFYRNLFELLDISRNLAHRIEQETYSLSLPGLNLTKNKFLKNYECIIKELHDTDPLISKKLTNLQRIECIRIEEAMSSLEHNCNLASVVMAVSAVEYRLHKLMEKKSKSLYNREFKEKTLGGIIELFRKDSRYTNPKYKKFKSILPNKHSHLMEILNTYRIFTAHPKEEEISQQTAKAILSFSCILLVDSELKIK